MMIQAEIAELRKNHFVVLILDNEVTVSHFVATPALPWLRLVQRAGIFQIAEGYPNQLTAEQARFEMTNWDQVSLPAIQSLLAKLAEAVDLSLIGNNAGQGMPLARSLPSTTDAHQAAIIYAGRLPEIEQYAQWGYRTFWRRDQAVARLLELAQRAGRPLALAFVNTIQHNAANYHMP